MKLKLLPLLVVALAVSACGGAPASTVSQAPAVDNVQSMPAAAEESKSGALSESEASGGTAGGAPADASGQTQSFDRLVIKTADITIEVENVRAAEAAIRTRVSTLGGYVIQSQSSGVDENMQMTMSFRVPVERFAEALSDVNGLASKVISSAERGDDVTEEYVDLESRQKTLTATRDRLLDLLSRAQTVEETLQINNTLTEYQGQIDQVEGRMKFLSQSSAMSTVNVSLLPIPTEKVIEPEEGWQPLTIASRAFDDLLEFGQGIASFLIVLAVWSPVWGVLLVAGWLVLRKISGAKPTKAPPTTPAN